MKILAIASTLDIRFRLGCTPAWWQLFKALHETGNEIIAIPYLGKPIQSLWWRTYPNPCSWESTTYNSYLDRRKKKGISPSRRNVLSPVFDYFIENYIRPKWERHIFNILKKEKEIDAVIIMNVPMNHINGIPSMIKSGFKIPVIFYDGDLPTSLPKYTISRGFKFNYYINSDLSEYDAIIGNSEGCIKDSKGDGGKKSIFITMGYRSAIGSPS